MPPTITFDSINTEERTATFLVNGSEITRPIAREITDEALAEHLQALANGLFIEYADTPADEPQPITEAPVEPGYAFSDLSEEIDEIE